MKGRAIVLRGDARNLPLPDESVDLIVTSPPYWALRDYRDGDESLAGQIGAEASPGEYLESLWECTREWMRVLKPEGSLWINLGDKYSTGNSGQSGLAKLGEQWAGGGHSDAKTKRASRRVGGMPPKSLLGLPWMYAAGCTGALAQLGGTDPGLNLILRAEVIWSKCLSGGTNVYARINGREKVITVKDLARCVPGSVELWTGEKWSPMLRCEPTPPTEGRAASSAAARQARYRGKPIPALVGDLEIEFRNGERVGCTPNHKWPTQRGEVRADELTVGDVVPVVRLAPGTATPAGLDDEMTGWLVGLYIAEGSRSEDTVQIASHVKEQERFARLQDIADAFDGSLVVRQTKGNAATANISGKVIRAILDTYVGGRTSRHKRLAPACWRRSDVFVRAVLDGYLSGDGHYEAKTDRWMLGFTANYGLATDLRAIAARLGYSLRLRRTVHHFDEREFPGWSGTLYLDPARRKRPDGEIVAIRQSRARQFWNIEIADEPHRFALASGVLTCNSNGLPESVTDRVRRSHEQWFHLTKQPRYYSAVDEIREPVKYPNDTRHLRGGRRSINPDGTPGGNTSTANPLGKLPGSVWEIATQPLNVPEHLGTDHYAAFPMEWPRRIIRGWSPPGVCVQCGEGRRPVPASTGLDMSRPQARRALDLVAQHGLTNEHIAAVRAVGVSDTGRGAATQTGTGKNTAEVYELAAEARAVLRGYAREFLLQRPTSFEYRCACPEPTAATRPAVVLDPFGGTGTTALVASTLGRRGISIDRSADYCRIAQWRTADPGERARALGLPKPPPENPSQERLFEEIA